MPQCGQTLTGLKDISEYVGVSEDVLRNLIKNFKFPARQVGEKTGLWISNSAAIDEWSHGFARSGPLVKQKNALTVEP